MKQLFWLNNFSVVKVGGKHQLYFRQIRQIQNMNDVSEHVKSNYASSRTYTVAYSDYSDPFTVV